MNMVKLADYFFDKYAAEKPDTSFGVPINADKTRILKDKLILVYDKINKKITQLPEFRELNEELKSEPTLKLFNDLINELVINVEHLNLKEGFSYAARMIETLNQLRKELKYTLGGDKLIKMDLAIKNVQDTIWKEAKRILNIHDLRGLYLDYPELKGILEEVVPTWDFGKGRNPTMKAVKQNQESYKAMMKRLEKELAEEEKK